MVALASYRSLNAGAKSSFNIFWVFINFQIINIKSMSLRSLKNHENSHQMGQVMTPNYVSDYREKDAFRMR